MLPPSLTILVVKCVIPFYVGNSTKRNKVMSVCLSINMLSRMQIMSRDTFDFQQCGIFSCVGPGEPVQPPFKSSKTPNDVQSVA